MSKELESLLAQVIAFLFGTYSGWLLGTHQELNQRRRDAIFRLEELSERILNKEAEIKATREAGAKGGEK